MGRIVQRINRLGSSVVSLMGAEVRALGDELGETGQAFGRVAIQVAVLGTFIFWTVAVLLFAAVAGLSLVLPSWAAALIVAGVLLLVTLVIYLRVRKRLSELERPVAIVRRRVDDHLAFWQGLSGEQAPRGASTERPDLEENW